MSESLDDVDDDARLPRRIDWGLWRRLLVHVRPHLRVVLGLVTCGIALAMIDIGFPLLTRTVIDAITASERPDVDAVRWVGTGLVRPECVLATASGDIYTADWRGGVAHLRPDGGYIALQLTQINDCVCWAYLKTHLPAPKK